MGLISYSSLTYVYTVETLHTVSCSYQMYTHKYYSLLSVQYCLDLKSGHQGSFSEKEARERNYQALHLNQCKLNLV